MKIADRTEGDVVVLSLSGRLDAATSEMLERRFDELFPTSRSRFVLGMKDVDYVSSIGLRVLLTCSKKCAAAGGGVVLAGMHPFVEDIINLVGFNRIIKIAPSEADAVAMLAASQS